MCRNLFAAKDPLLPSVGQLSTTLVQTEIIQQLCDGLPWNLEQTVIISKGWIWVTSVHEAKFVGSSEMFLRLISIKFGAVVPRPLRIHSNAFVDG